MGCVGREAHRVAGEKTRLRFEGALESSGQLPGELQEGGLTGVNKLAFPNSLLLPMKNSIRTFVTALQLLQALRNYSQSVNYSMEYRSRR